MPDKTVSIRHRPGTYNVYRNLNNNPWYALAEFVDNALQSFEANKRSIKKIDDGSYSAELKSQSMRVKK